MENEFREIIKDIVSTERFQSMKNYIHHGSVSAYSHSVAVAYLCYRYHKRKHPKYDIRELVRGAILHDYYLYDWHHKGEGHRLHGFRHPAFALHNARRDFEITPRMADIILHHMFPLTIIPPQTRAGWVVQHFDKVATHIDYRKASIRKKRAQHR